MAVAAPSPAPLKVSVVIPTWNRSAMLRRTLRELLSAEPPVEEILIHIDAGDTETAPMLDREFAGQVSWRQSATTQGPGGGRNLLFRQARHPLVACFDDDSWPMDRGFFGQVVALFTARPEVAVVACPIVMPSIKTPLEAEGPGNCFENCGCVLRREAFLATAGYLPLRYAYGAEETDVALQLLDAGWSIWHAPALRVYHDSEHGHHRGKRITSAHIRNTGLLVFLRYPWQYWPLGIAQVANRAVYSFRVHRRRGIVTGLLSILPTCWQWASRRKTVAPATIRKSRQIARARRR